MHKYLRAIGFSQLEGKRPLKELLTEVVMNPDYQHATTDVNGDLLGDYSKNITSRLGITVCGEYDEENRFIYDFYFPYLLGNEITSCEEISVDRHAEKSSYAGVCDELRVGISLIFYLQNRIPYVKAEAGNMLPIQGTSVTLTGLSIGGSVLLPIKKNEEQIAKTNQRKLARTKLMEEARKGSEEAIETLTMEDMDTYSVISGRIGKEDILSMVDTYFMPYGVECDLYSVLGEIKRVEKERNPYTGEEIYILKIESNDLTFDLCINIMDLFGEPKVGRRFKGTMWLQGHIHFPTEEERVF